MEQTFNHINLILTEWNPIGVPEDIATQEYKGYIPSIIKSITNRESLMNCLEDIIVNKIGLDYDKNNETQSIDLENICDKILQVYKQTTT